MEHSLCAFCLKGVEQQRQPRFSLSTSTSPRSSTQDFATLCKLLSPQPPELESCSNGLIDQQDGHNCSLCPTCTELIQEMGQIRDQISQLQAQFGKRIVLLRNMILGSDVNKRLDQLHHPQVDDMEKLRAIREILLNLSSSAPDDNFIITPETPEIDSRIDVKIEPEDGFNDDDTFSHHEDHPPSSPSSSFLLHPDDEDGLICKNEEYLDSSLSANSKPLKNATLRRSGRKRAIKPKIAQPTPPPKKKLTPPSSSSESETSSSEDSGDDDPEFEPLMLKDTIKMDEPPGQNSKPHSWPCTRCGKRFRVRSQLKKHRKSEHASTPFVVGTVCTLCKKGFTRKQTLDEHMIIRHERADKTWSCHKCSKGFSLELNYKRHLHLHKEERVKPLVCDICDSRFSDQARLDKHSAHHDTSVRCEVCSHLCRNNFALASGAKLKNCRSLEFHKKTHASEKPEKCNVCDARFYTKATLARHVLRHTSTGERPFPCSHCDCKYLDKSHLTKHVKEKHTEGGSHSAPAIIQDVEGNSSPKVF